MPGKLRVEVNGEGIAAVDYFGLVWQFLMTAARRLPVARQEPRSS
ncbi:MAG: hypothetical protein WDM87_10000 [Terracidiphilus sp.]